MAEQNSKQILIAGDLIWDFNLVKAGDLAGSYSEPIDKTVLSVTPGGAWFLKALVERAVVDRRQNWSVVAAHAERTGSLALPTPRTSEDSKGPPPTVPMPVACAFTEWDEFARCRIGSDEDRKAKAWRIREFLGCQRPEYPQLDKDQAVEASADTPASPSLVILDDLGLGFRFAPQPTPKPDAATSGTTERLLPSWWPEAIKGGQPERIILKLGSLEDGNDLLEHLLKKYAERLTVVLSADDLRQRGAILSKGLSWDRTKEDIVREFREGRSLRDLALARRVIVAFGLEGVASFTRCDRRLGNSGSDPESHATPANSDCVRETVSFERFLFIPDETEGAFRRNQPGRLFGGASILTAAVARHELEPTSYPLFIALGRGLQAARKSHFFGVQVAPQTDNATQLDLKLIGDVLHPSWTLKKPAPETNKDETRPKEPRKKKEPADAFKSAFPHYVLTDERLGKQPDHESDLLQDVAGVGTEAMTALAMAIVLQGTESALDAAPKARVGAFLTVDRDEIERINALRNLFETYLTNPKDLRPLSIAVFGQPGSGKSFAVKELAKMVFPGKPDIVEFNLSQFPNGEEELHRAFHRVRDASVKGTVPLVFWDEFDSDRLRWLKYFLTPMWDAEFRAGSAVHPIGKCIFVFAGGTAASFEDFVQRSRERDPVRPRFRRGFLAAMEQMLERQHGPAAADDFKSLKGPDFISRLSGYLNIKGPNPADLDPSNPRSNVEQTRDPAFVIRRAVLLRSLLERFYPQLFDSQKQARVSTGIVRAFLRTTRYVHGARSVEAVLRMSRLEGTKFFGPSQLPTNEQLHLHVSDDFLKLVTEGEVEAPVIEAMARAVHQAWMEERKEVQNYVWGSVRDDFAIPHPTHPLLKPYDELSESEKEGNRRPAREIRAKLSDVGLTIHPLKPHAVNADVPPDLRKKLYVFEHDRWLREKLLVGFEWTKHLPAGTAAIQREKQLVTPEDLRLHHDVTRYDDLPRADGKHSEQSIDQRIVDALLAAVERGGYTLAAD